MPAPPPSSPVAARRFGLSANAVAVSREGQSVVRVVVGSLIFMLVCIAVARADESGNGRPRGIGRAKPMGHGTPQHQAPYQPGRSPYVTGQRQRPKYFVPPTLPRTPTWEMYGTPPSVRSGDWPTYAPLGFGGYRFPAVGNQAYR